MENKWEYDYSGTYPGSGGSNPTPASYTPIGPSGEPSMGAGAHGGLAAGADGGVGSRGGIAAAAARIGTGIIIFPFVFHVYHPFR